MAKNDSGIPQPVNASFEQSGPDNEVVGWFYVRQAQIVEDPTAPDGRHCLVLSNSVAGQNAHVMQAVGLDGRKLKSVTVSVHRRTRGISDQPDKSRHPRVELTFYDEDRALIRTVTLGPWDGDHPWSEERAEAAVPGRSRFARHRDCHVRHDGRVRRRRSPGCRQTATVSCAGQQMAEFLPQG